MQARDDLSAFSASVIEGLSAMGRRLRPDRRRRCACYRPSPLAGGVAELEGRRMLSQGGAGVVAPAADPGTIQFPSLPAAGTSQGDEDAVMFTTTILKPVTITNHYTSTIYPVLSATNEPSNDGKPYDPFDAPHQDYRLYVGYSDASGNHLGLQSGQSITFNIPQALWDGGRIDFVTDTPETEASFYASGNPFNYDPGALTYIQPVANNGVLMLYHSTDPAVKGIATDAASQVAEYTIRDTSTTPTIPDSVDLDVQYIDALYLPVAMEAVLPGSPQSGWIGSINDVKDFQATVKSFVDGGLLSGYFGAQGWPQVLLSDTGQVDPNALVKIPGAYNIFANSASPSSFNTNLPYLTSSQTNGNASGIPGTDPNYAVNGITRVIFSWAEFYRKHFAGTEGYEAPTPQLKAILRTGLQQAGVKPFHIKTITPQDLARAKAFSKTVWHALVVFSHDPNLNTNVRYLTSAGKTTKGSTTLSGLDPAVVHELKNVMGVVGPAVLNRTQVNNPTTPPAGARSIQLNQPATATATGTYRFYYDTLPPGQGGVPSLQATSQLVGYILGDNVGDLANVPGFTTAAERQAVTEGTVIPLFHGVASPASPQSDWYPKPGDPTTSGVAKYNIDPLVWLIHAQDPATKQNNWPPAFDPVLAYAFSVDDGIGNITVNDATAFQIDIGGDQALTNKSPYAQS